MLFRIWLFTVPSPCFSRHNTQSVPVLRKGNSSAALARRNPWPHGVTGALRPTGQQMAASGQRARGLLDAKGPLEAARGRGLDNWSRRQATVGWGLVRCFGRTRTRNVAGNQVDGNCWLWWSVCDRGGDLALLINPVVYTAGLSVYCTCTRTGPCQQRTPAVAEKDTGGRQYIQRQ